jgi:hypothetical protein
MYWQSNLVQCKIQQFLLKIIKYLFQITCCIGSVIDKKHMGYFLIRKIKKIGNIPKIPAGMTIPRIDSPADKFFHDTIAILIGIIGLAVCFHNLKRLGQQQCFFNQQQVNKMKQIKQV